MISNVAGTEVRLAIQKQLDDMALSSMWVAASAQSCGVKNSYKMPHQLGSDRWAALIAAWQLKKAACVVVNAGTAITIDALTAEGVFMGGMILPGLYLMRASLAANTAGLEQLSGTLTLFPQNTGDAMISGAIQAISGAVVQMHSTLAGYEKTVPHLLLTGGDSSALLAALDDNAPVAVETVEHLVLGRVGFDLQGKLFMKWLVILLLVANFGLLGFFLASDYMLAHQDAIVTPPPPPYTGAIKLLSDADVAALPKRAPEPAPVVAVTPTESCYEWGSFNTADSARALSALKKLNLQKPDMQITAKAVPKQESTRYWVYIPAQKTMEEAQTKNDEIKALGVNDTLILQDAQWHNAISLGMFKDEALANKFIDKLHAMGIKNAIKAKRGFGNNQTSYTIHNVQPEQLVKLTALKPHFSTGELKQVDCN